MTTEHTPAIGEVVAYKGRSLTFLGKPEPYQTKAGQIVTLYAWGCPCDHCGHVFETLGRNRPSPALRRCCSMACASLRLQALADAKRLSPDERRAKNRAKDARRRARNKAAHTIP